MNDCSHNNSGEGILYYGALICHSNSTTEIERENEGLAHLCCVGTMPIPIIFYIGGVQDKISITDIRPNKGNLSIL